MYLAQSKHPSVAEQHARLRAAETSVRNAAARNGWKVPAGRREELRERVEELSAGRNTVLYTAEGVPGIYVRIPADRLRGAVGTELGADTHEAFIVSGNTIPAFYLGKYQASAVNHTTGALIVDPVSAAADGRILSLPGLDPVATISFDVSRALCEQNGAGFHLQTNAEWSYLLLKSLEGGYEPRGANDNAGGDTLRPDERSDLPSLGAIKRSLTGTGPWSWSHDMTPYGAWDLNGNIWEWCAGLRINAGEINVIPDNDAALGATIDMGAGVGDWQSLLAAGGDYAAPGAPGVLHYDYAAGAVVLSDETLDTSATSYNVQFLDMAAKDGLTPPARLKRLGLFPLTAAAPARGRFYFQPTAERLPLRGGAWNSGSYAGLAALSGVRVRSRRDSSSGCRSAFVL